MNAASIQEPLNGALVGGRIDTAMYRKPTGAVSLPGMVLGTRIRLSSICTYEFKRRSDGQWDMASLREGSMWMHNREIFEDWKSVQTFLHLMRIVDLEYLEF